MVVARCTRMWSGMREVPPIFPSAKTRRKMPYRRSPAPPNLFAEENFRFIYCSHCEFCALVLREAHCSVVSNAIVTFSRSADSNCRSKKPRSNQADLRIAVRRAPSLERCARGLCLRFGRWIRTSAGIFSVSCRRRIILSDSGLFPPMTS